MMMDACPGTHRKDSPFRVKRPLPGHTDAGGFIAWRQMAPFAAGRHKERSEKHMAGPKNQGIHCSVESCKHLKQEQGLCSLSSIQGAPTPMAYSGDPADESMCQSYDCK